MGTHDAHRWERRPVASWLVRLAVFCAPIAAGVAAGRGMAALLPPPSVLAETVTWWAMVVGAATAALLGVDQIARHFLPLAWLLRMALLFPGKAPRRWQVAVRTGTVRDLEAHLAQARTAGVANDATDAASRIIALVTALQAHDRHTRGHAERVRVYTDMLTAELGLPPEDRERLRWASLLHDIGKLSVAQSVLNKPDRPDEDEWRTLQRHPEEGARFCGPLLDWLGPWGNTIVEHHERYDGTGYPAELAGEDIGRGARIVAVPDAYEVMTAPRPYKKVMSAKAARQELADHAGTQFDPAVVRAFLCLSVRRLQLIAGPAAWLAQLPFLTRPPNVKPAVVSLGLAIGALAVLNLGGALRSDAVRIVETQAAGAALEDAGAAGEGTSTAGDDAREAPQDAAPRSASDVVIIRPQPGPVDEPRMVAGPLPGPGPIIILPDPDPGPEPGPDPGPVETPVDPPPPAPNPEPTVIASPLPEPTRPPVPPTEPPAPTPTEPPPPPPPPPPAPAVAVADGATTVPRGSVTIPVLANDGGDLDPSSLAVITQPQHGTATVSGGQILYEAQPGWTGTEQFAYRVCGLDGACASAPVSVTVVRD